MWRAIKTSTIGNIEGKPLVNLKKKGSKKKKNKLQTTKPLESTASVLCILSGAHASGVTGLIIV